MNQLTLNNRKENTNYCRAHYPSVQNGLDKESVSQQDNQLYKSKNCNHSGCGQQIRIAMEMLLNKQSPISPTEKSAQELLCKPNGSSIAKESCDKPLSEPRQSGIDDIRRALYLLNERQNTDLAQLLELLVQFDDLEGWRDSGARHCVAWMNQYLHIDLATGWERLRVGRQLRELPVISSLFRANRLSWSKVRLLTRIASTENEQQLAHASLDASVSDVSRICDDYRWNDSEKEDQIRDEKQIQNRSLTWRRLHNGNTAIRLELPPEQAQSVLLGIEQCEQLLFETEKASKTDTDSVTDNGLNSISPDQISAKQRKADAAIMMANRSIALDREDLPTAERYHVVLNVDVNSLAKTDTKSKTNSSITDDRSSLPGTPISKLNESDRTLAFLNAFDPEHCKQTRPPRRAPIIEGVGPVSIATARRLTCDCRITTLLTEDGEPLSIGRKARIWPVPMRTAIIARDRHCQFPGCTAHRHLHIHHIVHWADGGETSIDNGVCLCQKHHQLIHAGQFDIVRADSVNFSALIRTDRLKHSYEDNLNTEYSGNLHSAANKALLPTRCRFIVRRLHKSEATTTVQSHVAEENSVYRVDAQAAVNQKNPDYNCYLISDYARGDYARGDYARGEHARGEYARGDYACGDYARGDHACGDYARGNYRRGNCTCKNVAHKLYKSGLDLTDTVRSGQESNFRYWPRLCEYYLAVIL